MTDMEKLFECVLLALKADIEMYTDKPGAVRVLFISNQQLAQALGGDFRRVNLPPLLMELMTWRSESAYSDGQYISYKNFCTAYTIKKDGVIIHIYPETIKFLKGRNKHGKKE